MKLGTKKERNIELLKEIKAALIIATDWNYSEYEFEGEKKSVYDLIKRVGEHE